MGVINNDWTSQYFINQCTVFVSRVECFILKSIMTQPKISNGNLEKYSRGHHFFSIHSDY